jgi:hypothetical protein
MSFNAATTGVSYAPGWFLADNEHCTRETRTIPANHAEVKTAANGGKYVPMGAYVANAGILYEDVDVTTGDMPGSVVTAGTVYQDRVGAAAVTAKTTLEGLGIKFITATPAVTRPDDA